MSGLFFVRVCVCLCFRPFVGQPQRRGIFKRKHSVTFFLQATMPF